MSGRTHPRYHSPTPAARLGKPLLVPEAHPAVRSRMLAHGVGVRTASTATLPRGTSAPKYEQNAMGTPL